MQKRVKTENMSEIFGIKYLTPELPKVTVSLPCYKRPERTLRAIECIRKQTVRKNIELLITIDGDIDLLKRVFSLYYNDPSPTIEDYISDKYLDGFKIQIDCVEHGGNWGTAIRNKHIREASGKHFIFMGSDDTTEPNHVENYLSQIEGTDLDFVAFDSYVEPNNAPRNTQFQEGMIGHSELIIRTDFLRTMPPHEPVYGHDWTLVKNMMAATGKYKKAVGAPQTYIVKSIPGKPEQGID